MIRIGTSTKNQQDIILGTQKMSRVYIGDKLVWQKERALTLIKYGALYNFPAASKNGGSGIGSVAPDGYHVPTNDEIITLATFSGDTSISGAKFKEIGTEYWTSDSGATNDYLFNARGAGTRYAPLDNYIFIEFKNQGIYWTCTDSLDTPGHAHVFGFVYNSNVFLYSNPPSNLVNLHQIGRSIRLIKNTSDWAEGETVTDIDGNIYPTIKIGDQVWMAANLAVTKYNNGTPIPNVTGSSAWQALTTHAYCWYNNDINNK